MLPLKYNLWTVAFCLSKEPGFLFHDRILQAHCTFLPVLIEYSENIALTKF